MSLERCRRAHNWLQVVRCCGMEAVEKAMRGCLRQLIPSHLVLGGVTVSIFATSLWKPTRESSARHRWSGEEDCNTLWYISPYPPGLQQVQPHTSPLPFFLLCQPILVLHAHRGNHVLGQPCLSLYLDSAPTSYRHGWTSHSQKWEEVSHPTKSTRDLTDRLVTEKTFHAVQQAERTPVAKALPRQHPWGYAWAFVGLPFLLGHFFQA